QVSNLRDQCNLLNQNLSLMHLRHQFYYNFLNIEEKIYHKIVNQKEKMKKKDEIIRLINKLIIKVKNLKIKGQAKYINKERTKKGKHNKKKKKKELY
ncbi:hypothetical protein TTHERM_002653359, partial (macronuclear) [Tetrahymena thermophila SB210]